MSPNKFIFEISLSVLNHLGRNLYRNFVTVLGEAISNSWDADAKNVYIYIDREKENFFIKDDGIGMTDDDFQQKFLRIGYSKRKRGENQEEEKSSPDGRPYIGRKGIGKLALLSCADRVSVASKTKHMKKHVGGSIDNSALDLAIKDDLEPSEYPLEGLEPDTFAEYTESHEQGTIIRFENIRGGIRNRVDYLKRIIALYFRFSLHDDSFNIFINDEKITLDHLGALAEKTSFAWKINEYEDPYVDQKLTELKESVRKISMDEPVNGFIASVEKPSDLKIRGVNERAGGVDERAGVDLFVNGRLRERNILRHIPTSRYVENYLYGQIHFDGLDDREDRFTSSREGIVADDPKYQKFLQKFRTKILRIIADWDKLRVEWGQDGDPDNEKDLTKEKRKSLELLNLVSKQYKVPKQSENKKEVESWRKELAGNTANLQSYANCFISENLLRKYIKKKGFSLSESARDEAEKLKNNEQNKKQKEKIHIDIRETDDDLNYLNMLWLAKEATKREKHFSFEKDEKQYTLIRNAVAHTAPLTEEAKLKLAAVSDNIKSGIIKLLS